MQNINLSLVLRMVFITFPIIMFISVLSACTDDEGFQTVTDVADDQGRKTVVIQNNVPGWNNADVTSDATTTDVSEGTADSDTKETSGLSVTTHQKDAGQASDEKDSKEPVIAAETPVSPSIEKDTTYATMEYGYMFSYPKDWDMKEFEGGVTLSTEKVVDEATEKDPEEVEVKFTFIWLPEGEKFGVWMQSLPQGDETHSFNGKEFKFIAADTEGPFMRTHYRGMYNKGALKIELWYNPAYTIPLETDSADWKDYIEAQEEFKKEVMESFLKIIDSIKQNV